MILVPAACQRAQADCSQIHSTAVRPPRQQPFRYNSRYRFVRKLCRSHDRSPTTPCAWFWPPMRKIRLRHRGAPVRGTGRQPAWRTGPGSRLCLHITINSRRPGRMACASGDFAAGGNMQTNGDIARNSVLQTRPSSQGRGSDRWTLQRGLRRSAAHSPPDLAASDYPHGSCHGIRSECGGDPSAVMRIIDEER